MITPETLQHVGQGPAIEEAAKAALRADNFLALPNNFQLHDLEKWMELRRRARGKMTTPSIEHFAGYIESHAETGATVFVDPPSMTATAVLNLGGPGAPGHADNLALLRPRETAAYLALQQLLSISKVGSMGQRILAEFLEDWTPQVRCITGEGDPLEVKRAIDAVRRITIESARSVESEEQSLSAQRSVMESVAATSKAAPLPAVIEFMCEPYMGLAQRTFALRLSVRTGAADKPTLTLGVHLIKGEQHTQEMAEELARKVTDAIGNGFPTCLGEYRAAA